MSGAGSRSLRAVIGGYSPDELRARVGGVFFLFGRRLDVDTVGLMSELPM
jgi:hypothetical protein